MALTIKQLAKGKVTASGEVIMYTVPANTRAVIRQMNFYTATAGDDHLVRVDDGTDFFRIEDDVASGNSETKDHQLVLEATQELQLFSTTHTTDLWYVISGAEIV